MKNKALWIVSLLSLVLIISAYFIGDTFATIELKNEKINYEKLEDEIRLNEDKVGDLQKKIKIEEIQLSDLGKEVEEMKTNHKDAFDIVNALSENEQKLNNLKTDISTQTTSLEDLKKQIDEKNKELALVTGQVLEKKEEPKTLSAGFFTVGKDIPVSRYKVIPNGDFGNFFVNGGMKVNVILGKGAVNEYVFYAAEGDEIELTISAKFVPIQ